MHSGASQDEADAAVEITLKSGVNHFDVAPSYGEAELRLAPSMKRHRAEIQRFRALGEADQELLVQSAASLKPLWPQ